MAVNNASVSAAANTADRELVFKRVFDAPRDLVFQMWTHPEHAAQWWGPRGFTTTIHEMDVRPGGVWRLVMRGPDGVDYRNRIVFLEVVKSERLVYKYDPEEGSEPVSFQVTVNFSAHGGKTELTMRMLFPSAETRHHVVEKYGAVAGANQTLDRLAEHLTQVSAGKNRAFTNPVCELDPRPGGAIRIHMRGPDGAVYPMTGVYHEIVEPQRLVFTSAALDENGDPLFEVLNTVTFAEHQGKTKLTVHAVVVKTTAGAARYLAGMEMGWSQTLDRLATEVE
jgi:uncharacterized protein YndB with AHSA1/START domain